MQVNTTSDEQQYMTYYTAFIYLPKIKPNWRSHVWKTKYTEKTK